MEQGWVKFYREWLDNPIITKDSEHLAVWTYLNCSATHIEKDVIFNGKKITLRRGQMIVSCKEIYEKLKIERNKMDRIIKLFKNEELIEQQTRNHKSLITLAQWDFYQGFNEEQNEELIRNQRGTKQETENEKEKRSKREKDKEKEINKNEKNERIYIPPYIPPLGEMDGNAPFSLSEKHGQGTGACPQDLDRWLEEDDGIDDWDKVQIYYRNLNSSQQDSLTEDNETNGFALTNPIQQEKKERINPQPQTPSPFAAGEITQNACMSSSQRDVYHQPQGCMSSAAGERDNVAPYTLFDEFWKAYPKKIGKGYAFECFKKIRVSRSLLDTMLEAIAKQKKSDMWKRDKGQYIPNPSTWLNQKRWEDDLGGDTEDDGQIPWSKFNLGIVL